MNTIRHCSVPINKTKILLFSHENFAMNMKIFPERQRNNINFVPDQHLLISFAVSIFAWTQKSLAAVQHSNYRKALIKLILSYCSVISPRKGHFCIVNAFQLTNKLFWLSISRTGTLNMLNVVLYSIIAFDSFKHIY